jgi:hypothetical protein
MKNLFLFVVPFIILLGCGETLDQQKPELTKAEEIIQKSIKNHGGTLYDSASITFTFRNRDYTYARNEGIYTYTRAFSDSTGQIYDVLNNEGFKRYLNDSLVVLNDEMSGRYSQSVNSVWYFALLPFPLADAAVNLSYEGKETVKGKAYDLVRVTFDEEGGGKDHSDVFLYWFDADNASIGYMAYSYETEGGGVRFREAINRRVIEGIVFYDYLNYKPESKETPLTDLDDLFVRGELEKVSEIRLENIRVH